MAQHARGGKQMAALAVNNNIANMPDEIQLAKTGVSLYEKALEMVSSMSLYPQAC